MVVIMIVYFKVNVFEETANNQIEFLNLQQDTKYIVTGIAISGKRNSTSVNSNVETAKELTAPTNLRIENVTTGSFMVKWDSVEGADFYSVVTSLDAETVQPLLQGSSTGFASPEYFASQLIPGGKYTVEVSAIRNDQTSPKSTIDGTVNPSQIKSMRQIMARPTEIALSYESGPGFADEFIFEIAADDDPDIILGMELVKPNDGAVVFSYLEPDTQYTVNGFARSGDKISKRLPLDVNTVPDERLPPTPTNLRVTNVTSNSFFVRWDEHSDVEVYAIEVIYEEPGKQTRVYISTELISPSVNVTNLLPGGTYTIRVANIASGKYSYGMTSLATLFPSPLSDVEVVDITSDSVGIKFIPGPGQADKYTFTVSSAADPDVEVDSIVKRVIDRGVENVVTFNVLQPESTYKITGFVEKGDRKSSNTTIEVTTAPEDDTVIKEKYYLNPPRHIRYHRVTSSSFGVQWDWEEEAKKYHIEVRYLGDPVNPIQENAELIFSKSSDEPSFDVFGDKFVPGGLYSISVWNEGEGGKSATRSFIDTLRAPPVKNLMQTETGPNNITVEFTYGDGFSQSHTVTLTPFTKSRDISKGGQTQTVNLPTNDSSKVEIVKFSNLIPGQYYTVSVVAKSDERKSDAVSILAKSGEPLESIIVRPTPTSTGVTFTSPYKTGLTHFVVSFRNIDDGNDDDDLPTESMKYIPGQTTYSFETGQYFVPVTGYVVEVQLTGRMETVSFNETFYTLPLAPPKNVRIDDLTTDSFILTWDVEPFAKNYHYEVKSRGSPTRPVEDEIPIIGNSDTPRFEVENLIPGSIYSIKSTNNANGADSKTIVTEEITCKL
ncbi:tenascin-N-like [Styela clava]